MLQTLSGRKFLVRCAVCLVLSGALVGIGLLVAGKPAPPRRMQPT